VPYQYVREPLTVEEADRLANACENRRRMFENRRRPQPMDHLPPRPIRVVAVMGLETDPSVCGVASRRFSGSAQQNPSSQRMRSPRATATLTDGTAY
jgi:hypothetical protein